MARGEWGYQGRGKWTCSYKKTTLTVCLINIVFALYFLRSLYASLYVYSESDSAKTANYTPDQIMKMEESIRIQKESEPRELFRLVKEIKEEFSREEMLFEMPHTLKQKITDEILWRLRNLNASANIHEQRKTVESWRKEKLEAARQLCSNKEAANSTMSNEEADILVKALESNWTVLSEEIGLWLPPEIINKEHDDKPEGADELEDEILPGRSLPPECRTELHTDYSGAVVRWGLTHLTESAADCCQACLDQAQQAKPGQLKCNIWVYCPSEFGCHSPDIYQHKNMECWLKYAETPKLNFKDKYPESYRDSHPSAPVIVPWVSGVVS